MHAASRKPSPSFADWISGSAFVDANGAPIVWYHGTNEDEFNVFTRWDEASIGFHFGNLDTANARLDQIEAEDRRIVSVHCRAKRPLRLRDHHMWGLRNVLRELEDQDIVTSEEADVIYERMDDAWLFAAIERAGYDCVVYANDTEGHGDSLMVWRAQLLKAVDACSHDLDDARLHPDRGCTGNELMAHNALANEIEAARKAIDDLQFRSAAP